MLYKALLLALLPVLLAGEDGDILLSLFLNKNLWSKLRLAYLL